MFSMVAEFMMTMMDIFTMRDLTALNAGTLLGVYVLAAEVIYRIHENWMMKSFTIAQQSIALYCWEKFTRDRGELFFFFVKG